MTYTIQRQNHLGFIDEHDCLILSHVQAYRFWLFDLKIGDRIKIIKENGNIKNIEKLMPAKMRQGE